jgi:hypothetical protein
VAQDSSYLSREAPYRFGFDESCESATEDEPARLAIVFDVTAQGGNTEHWRRGS